MDPYSKFEMKFALELLEIIINSYFEFVVILHLFSVLLFKCIKTFNLKPENWSYLKRVAC